MKNAPAKCFYGALLSFAFMQNLFLLHQQLVIVLIVRIRLLRILEVHLVPGGVLPYMGYIGMCGAKGYGFSAVPVINWVSILAILPPFWS